MEELENIIQDMINAGENLQKYYHVSDGNENKLKSYALRLSNAVRANNVEKFMELVTNFYMGIEKKIPAEKGFEKLIKDQNTFRLLGNAYIFGLGKRPESKNKNEKIEGGNSDEK